MYMHEIINEQIQEKKQSGQGDGQWILIPGTYGKVGHEDVHL